MQHFHSEYKTDMDLERLPSGKFVVNQLVLNINAVRAIHRRIVGQALFYLDDLQRLHETVIQGVLEEIFLPRRLRANPCAVKRMMLNFPIKDPT